MAETVHLKNDYSKLNEALVKLFDESGVKRSFTVPYVEAKRWPTTSILWPPPRNKQAG